MYKQLYLLNMRNVKRGILFFTNTNIPNILKGTAHVLTSKHVHKELRNDFIVGGFIFRRQQKLF